MTFAKRLVDKQLIAASSQSVRSRWIGPDSNLYQVDITLPAILDSVHLDVAELVTTVRSVSDETDPLILVVAPVTDRSALANLAKVEDWVGNTEGLSTKYASLVPVTVTQESTEIRFDITPIVEMWLKGRIPNRGLVLRALSEEKSTFQLIQRGIFDGANARVEFMYSSRDR